MPGIPPDAFALLESSFHASPNFRSHKLLPRHRDELRSILPDTEPLKQDIPQSDDETESQVSPEHRSPLASPVSVNGAESGLPPTPPSNLQDERPSSTFSLPPYADGVVKSLMSKDSSLSTPVNQRSPPTPDPSPPRTTESMSRSMTLPVERPPIFAYPSSRAESFKTAREEFSSEAGNSRSNTPLVDRLSIVEEGSGLGLAFETGDSDVTPTNGLHNALSEVVVDNKPEKVQDPLDADHIPNREWDTNLMRNVTIRRKRIQKQSPQKNLDAIETASPSKGTTPRRTSSLRERVEASKNSPHTPSFEIFAHSIGWPAEAASSTPKDQVCDVEHKRLSGSSMTSTVVEAVVIVTPPQKRRALRHSGKNLAYRADSDSPTDHSSITHSNRNSLHSEDVPLHRLVHKRASINGRSSRMSIGSATTGLDRYASPLSIRKRGEDSAASTLAHQESLRRVLQPAADIMSRSNSVSRPYPSERSYHKRIASAPESTRRREFTPEPRQFLEMSPPESPRRANDAPMKLPQIEPTSPSTPGHKSHEASPLSPRLRIRRDSNESRKNFNINKSLPQLPEQSTHELPSPEASAAREGLTTNENVHPASQNDVVYNPPLEQQVRQLMNAETVAPLARRGSSSETVPTIRRGSLSLRGRSEERRRSSTSQDRTSTSRDAALLRPGLDRVPTEEMPRHSYEWHAMHSNGTRRVSFDSSTIGAEDHAMARHLFAQTTPFSQISDTPIEVSEATAVSIYPHNNQSLLVVQHLLRSSTQASEQRQIVDQVHYMTSDLTPQDLTSLPTPPFVDANEQQHEQPQGPTLNFEPATPPMQLHFPVNGVDSPLKNPRKPPTPPIIQFIPPTPAEELEQQLAIMPTPPGPPKRSDSHPQRRLSLVQRARRYSGSIISPFLARASSGRARYASDSHAGHVNPRIPNVGEGDGSLHPFWRPRGFWDGFEDSDSGSEDDALPQGGDTSDVEDPEPEPPKRLGSLRRRVTSGFKGTGRRRNSGGFLIGNSVGIERSGTNKRKPHILPPAKVVHAPRRISNDAEPKILIQPPTIPLGLSFRSRGGRVEKRVSSSSLRRSGTWDSTGYRDSGERSRQEAWRANRERRGSWKQGRTIPGLGVQVQYIGVSGIKDRIREKKAEKRRESIRKSIGSRYYHDTEAGGVRTAE